MARRPDGTLVTHKLLSEERRYEDAAIQGIRELMGVAAGQPLPEGAIEAVKMGTTVATNALLERKGDRTVFVTTRGFADSLRIAYQHRPKLFVRRIELPSMLYEEVVEVDERMGAHGDVVRPLDEAAAEIALRASFERGIRACAIVLMHGYRFPAHERVLEAIAHRIGFTQVSVSHRVSPLMRLVSRGDTTVADAYLSPVLRRYVQRVAQALPDVRLQFMQSNGGLSDAASFHGKDAILSGPAGGIVGAARAAASAGIDKIIAFDMGGTSTDVGHFAGEFERALDVEVGGVRLRTPILQIHTVAAGGGSIVSFDGVRLRVGPDSAGANPGPASYRRGGPLTVTDCNVLLGRIQADFFPALFGEKGDQPLDTAIVAEKFSASRTRFRRATRRKTRAVLAAGCIRIAVENMANAIKKISVQRGHDVTEYTLTCFGGAAGQHACLVADALGMQRAFIHPLAGVLSAYGIGLADSMAMRQQTIEEPLDDAALARLAAPFAAIEQEARAEIAAQGLPDITITVERALLLKYADTDSTLTLAARAGCHGGDTHGRVPASVPRPLRLSRARTRHRHRCHLAHCTRAIAAKEDETARVWPARTGALQPARTAPRLLRRRLARRTLLRARVAAAGRFDRGPRGDLRAAQHHRHRTRLARAGSAPPIICCWKRPRRRGARRPRRAPTRCCWRSSTTCSWPLPNRWA